MFGKIAITLDYSATGDCPGEFEMVQQIQRRTPAAERVSHRGDIEAVVRVDALCVPSSKQTCRGFGIALIQPSGPGRWKPPDDVPRG